MAKEYSAIEVNSYRDLNDYLSQVIPLEFQVGDDGVRRVNNAVKSFVVEADPATARRHESNLADFGTSRQTQESSLVHIHSDSVDAFIDKTDDRFLIVHSISKMTKVESFIHQVFGESTRGYDRAWLPNRFLETVRSVGNLRGFRFEFLRSINGAHLELGDRILPNRSLLPSDVKLSYPMAASRSVSPDLNLDRPNLRRSLSSLTFRDPDTAESDYIEMTRRGIFDGRHALDWIQYDVDVANSGAYINQMVYFDGKVTAYGSSSELHLHLVDQIRNRYAEEIRRIENEYSMSWASTSGGSTLVGEPLYVIFPESLVVEDLVSLARSIFRAGPPFRLFGTFVSRSSSRVDIEAIDLHTGGKFSGELTRSWLRLYLPKGTCGNVAARFLTVMQRSLGSKTRLVDGNEMDLLTGEVRG